MVTAATAEWDRMTLAGDCNRPKAEREPTMLCKMMDLMVNEVQVFCKP